MIRPVTAVMLIAVMLCLSLGVVLGTGSEQARCRSPGDLCIEDITIDGSSVDGKYVKEAHQITVWLNNSATTPLTGETMNCTIYDATSVQKAFTNISISTIANDTIDDRIVGAWTPLAEDTYWINITIDHNGTRIYLNKSFVIDDIFDIYPEILSPLQNISVVARDPEDKAVGCKARIFNIGNKPILTAFSVDLEIFDITNASNVYRVYNYTKSYTAATFDIGANVTYDFPAWTNHTYGLFKFVVTTNLSTDNVPANNKDNVTMGITYTYWDEVRRGDIAGCVVDIGNAPIEGVSVTIAGGVYDATATTNATGWFLLEGLPIALSPYTINLSKPWYEPTQRFGVYVDENLTNTLIPNITMLAIIPCTVSGYVTDTDGLPLSGACVTVSGVGSNITNETGFYSITSIPMGNYILNVTLADHVEYTCGLNLSAGEFRWMNVTLVLEVQPTVTFWPANGSKEISPDEPIIITFNLPFDYITVNETTVLFTSLDEEKLSYDVATNLDDTQISITPHTMMKCGYTYTTTITPGVLKKNGNSMFGTDMSATFTVTPPRVILAYPPDQTANVAITTTDVSARFNTRLLEPIPTNSFTLMAKPVGQAAREIPGRIVYEPVNLTLRFVLDEALEDQMKYNAVISSLTSIDGIAIVSYSWEFATETLLTTGSLEGHVYNKNGYALYLVSVSILGTDCQCFTDSNGYFKIVDIAPGQYTMRIALDGYQIREMTVTITAGETADIKTFNGGQVVRLTEVKHPADDGDGGGDSSFGSFCPLILFVTLLLGIVIVCIIIVRVKNAQSPPSAPKPSVPPPEPIQLPEYISLSERDPELREEEADDENASEGEEEADLEASAEEAYTTPATEESPQEAVVDEAGKEDVEEAIAPVADPDAQDRPAPTTETTQKEPDGEEKTEIVADTTKEDKVHSEAKLHFMKGMDHYTNGEYEKALKEWETALAAEPDNKNVKKSIEQARLRIKIEEKKKPHKIERVVKKKAKPPNNGPSSESNTAIGAPVALGEPPPE